MQNQSPTPVAPAGEKNLSLDLPNQIDYALVMEEFHRDQLIWWEQRRKWLEQQIPLNNLFAEFINSIQELDNEAKSQAL